MHKGSSARSHEEIRSNSNVFELKRGKESSLEVKKPKKAKSAKVWRHPMCRKVEEASPPLHLGSHLHHRWKRSIKGTTPPQHPEIHLPFHSHPSTSLHPIDSHHNTTLSATFPPTRKNTKNPSRTARRRTRRARSRWTWEQEKKHKALVIWSARTATLHPPLSTPLLPLLRKCFSEL